MYTVPESRRHFWQYYLQAFADSCLVRLQRSIPPLQRSACRVTRSLIDDLMPQLDPVLAPTVVMWVAQTKGQTGPAHGKAYASLFSQSADQITACLEYFHPHVFCHLARIVQRFECHVFKFLRRLDENWIALKQVFALCDLDELIEIRLTKGDAHADGSRTSSLLFKNSDGEERGFIYKPINLQIENFLQALEPYARSDQVRLHYYIPTERYGYLTYLPYEAKVESLDHAKSLYEQYGALLAFGELVRLSDGHAENFRIAKGGVYWLDRECAFHDMGSFTALNSPLEATGMLYIANPLNTYGGIISALQAGDLAQLSLTTPLLANDETDELSVRYFGMFKPDSLPHRFYHQNQLCQPENFLEEIQVGYCRAAKKLHANKQCILEILHAWVERSSPVVCRHLMLPTACYARNIRLLQHPVGVSSKRLLRRLKKERLGTLRLPQETKNSRFIIQHEWTDCTNGIIPYFYRRADDRHLYHASGAAISSFFETSLWQTAKIHLSNYQIDSAHLSKACTFIEQAIRSTAGLKNFQVFQKTFNFPYMEAPLYLPSISPAVAKSLVCET